MTKWISTQVLWAVIGTKCSILDQIKFVEDSLQKIWKGMICVNFFKGRVPQFYLVHSWILCPNWNSGWVSYFSFPQVTLEVKLVSVGFQTFMGTWKVSVFGVFLVHIFPHLDGIRTRKILNTSTFYAVFPGRTNILDWVTPLTLNKDKLINEEKKLYKHQINKPRSQLLFSFFYC